MQLQRTCAPCGLPRLWCAAVVASSSMRQLLWQTMPNAPQARTSAWSSCGLHSSTYLQQLHMAGIGVLFVCSSSSSSSSPTSSSSSAWGRHGSPVGSVDAPLQLQQQSLSAAYPGPPFVCQDPLLTGSPRRASFRNDRHSRFSLQTPSTLLRTPSRLLSTSSSSSSSSSSNHRSSRAAADLSRPDIVLEDTLRVCELIQRFQSRGHLAAQLDPLKRTPGGPWLGPIGDEYTRADYTLAQVVGSFPASASADEQAAFIAQQIGLQAPTPATRLFDVGSRLPASAGGGRRWWSLPDIVRAMRDTYCSNLALEFKHLWLAEEQAWLKQRFEARRSLTTAEKAGVLQLLLSADTLERFLAQKFPATKRFGLEGCEALLPGLHSMVGGCAAAGVRRIEMGVSHRGRLNLLVNLLGKPLGALCTEMEGKQSEFRVGDVKYHLGQSGSILVRGGHPCPPQPLHQGTSDATMPTGHDQQQQQQQEQERLHEVRLSIAPNPSHLEAVGPVVLGMVRAEQQRLKPVLGGLQQAQRQVMPLLLHGDAAFAGLGCVAECLQLANVDGFTVGGTIHVVINNQVGFTTMPRHGRSSAHCTDMVKIIGAPVLHANADDPEAVCEAFMLAAEWRARWAKDVVIDLVGYRRNGHNELDNPAVTLPLTYRCISEHSPVLDLYAARLQQEGVVTADQLAKWREQVWSWCEGEWQAAEAGRYKETAKSFLISSWQGDALTSVAAAGRGPADDDPAQQEPTGLPLTTLQRVGRASCKIPVGFALHPEVEALLSARRAMVESGESRVDWSMAEVLAWGTLMLQRDASPDTPHPFLDDPDKAPLGWGLNRGHYDIRLTGQDVQRGTFNQRHAMLWDQRTARSLVLLNHIKPSGQDELQVWNSPLAEGAVLGYEYGYSLGARDTALVMWEAQFGDFANNAQVVIDQFIASGEEKWGQQSGLVVLLPHGYDGQGPDHSSARVERFLQLCNDDPDHLPGYSPAHQKLMQDTYDAIRQEAGGKVDRELITDVLTSLHTTQQPAHSSLHQQLQQQDGELVEMVLRELQLPGHPGANITWPAWESFMVQYLRRHAERHANMFVVNATTPAQYFHLLRRQVNLPHKKPLILFTPKYLLHHRPCTSALNDFTMGHFFNRVIDDGKVSDNTRHLAVHPRSGKPFLAPAQSIRRVILCTGQIYYFLSRLRRAKRQRDVVLVRLEQISPFPHDLLTSVIRQYTNAELVWVQEEPKNMGAWDYVRPRLRTALSAGLGEGAAPGAAAAAPHVPVVKYIGRPAASSTATASFAIHQKETQEILEAALTF